MSEPIANAFEVLKSCRYALLAGTLLATLAIPQWSTAADAGFGRARDEVIVVAQRVDPNDPRQKGKQGQQGKQGQGQQGQPKQFGNRPLPGAQQGQQGRPGEPGAPKGPGQRQFGKQSPGGEPGEQKQFGKGSPGGAGQQGREAQQGGSGQPGRPLEPGQQKQLGKQPPSGSPQQGGGPGGAGQQKQFGKQSPGAGQGQQKQFGKQLPGGPGEPGQQGGPGRPGGPGAGQFGKQAPAGSGPQFGRQTPGGGQQPPAGQQPGGPQFGKQTPGGGQQPPGGRQPVQGGLQPPRGGAGVANFEELRSQRREHTEAGRTVIEEPGKRLIVRDNSGRTIIAHDEGERFRAFAPDARVVRRGPETFTTYQRAGGVQVINVTDANGRLLRRLRRGPDGREVVLIENGRGPGFGTGLAVGLAAGAVAGIAAGVFLDLPPPVVTIPRDRYIVDAGIAPPALLYDTLEAPPLVPIERAYSLDEIRYNVALRDRMRRIDIDTINFEFGSWEVATDQYDRLTQLAESMQRVLSRDPDEVFMIEGHTDAVGSDEDNLSLSDRRAESVAVILSQQFKISPENLVTQGYGKQYLKIATQGPSRENRRVAVRRITPLLHGQQASR